MASQIADEGVTSTAPTVRDGEKQPRQSPPLYTRLAYTIAVFALQNLIIKPTMAYRHFQDARNRSETSPNIVKTYESRRHLPIRIFFPKTYDLKSPSALSLLFTIHGGGFVLGDPIDNDWWNRTFSNQHNTLVVALNYSKAPANAFPGPLSDLEALITAVFADSELKPHIDATKVGMAGWSAGGNLTLAISQFSNVREKITAGIVPLYPVVDFSISTAQSSKTRQYKPALGGFRARPNDFLLTMGGMFDWAYIAIGTNVRDPLLSPIYACNEDLPSRVWVIAAELDMLAHEGWRLISKLAERQIPSLETKVGKEEVGEPGKLVPRGDQRFAFEEKNRYGEYKWLLVPDAIHGFDQPNMSGIGLDAEAVVDGRTKALETIRLIGEWLWR